MAGSLYLTIYSLALLLVEVLHNLYECYVKIATPCDFTHVVIEIYLYLYNVQLMCYFNMCKLDVVEAAHFTTHLLI